MKILLATPEIEPFTGATPLGIAARRAAAQLHACPDTDVVVVLPAREALLRAHGKDLTEAGTLSPALGDLAEAETGRILRWNAPNAPETFVIDAPALRTSFDKGRPEDLAARGLVLWAHLLLALLERIRPDIHLAHGFGWESALLPVLIRTRHLPIATVLSTPPSREPGPNLRPVLSAARLWEPGQALSDVPEEALDRNLYSWAAACTDGSNALDELCSAEIAEDSNDAPPRRAHKEFLEKHGLDEDDASPLFFFPGPLPAIHLPVLASLLGTRARVVLSSSSPEPETEAALIALARDHPGRFLRIHSSQEPGALTASDFVLFSEIEQCDPNPESAIAHGCTPILSHRHPALTDPALRPACLVFREPSPEGIWDLLKKAIALHTNPARRAAQRARLLLAAEASEGLCPALSALYRRAVARKLKFD